MRYMKTIHLPPYLWDWREKHKGAGYDVWIARLSDEYGDEEAKRFDLGATARELCECADNEGVASTGRESYVAAVTPRIIEAARNLVTYGAGALVLTDVYEGGRTTWTDPMFGGA